MTTSSNPSSPPPSRLATLENYLRQDPDNASLLLEAFDAALAEGALDAAEFHLTNAGALGQGSWRWRLNRIHLELARHRWDAATALIGALRAEADLPVELAAVLAHDLAHVLFQQERTNEAIAALEPVLRAAGADAPLAAATQALWLRLLHRAERLDDAVAWARAREERGALAPDALGPAALLALDTGDFERGARWARLGLAVERPSAEALVAASAVSLAMRDGPGAERFARRALALNGDDGRSWSALGLAQMFLGRLPEACASLERAAPGIAHHVGTWLALGWAQLFVGRVDDAIRTFEHALALDRNFAECHGGLAAARAHRGERALAQEGIERALRLDRACASAHYAQLVLEGRGTPASGEVERLAQRLLAGRAAPFSGTPKDWAAGG